MGQRAENRGQMREREIQWIQGRRERERESRLGMDEKGREKRKAGNPE